MKKILCIAALVASGCAAPEETKSEVERANELSVYVVNYPLQYFAERIAGEYAVVSFPAPPSGDPAFWNPDAETIAAYQKADVILLNGAGYAKWVDRVSLPSSRLVDTSTAFRDRYIINDNAIVHTHGPEGEHSHGEIAFTTWLDPLLAVEHAKAIADSLERLRPEDEATFQEGFTALESDLRSLHERLENASAGENDRPLLGSHPVYQYLARRYQLNLRAVHFEPDALPDQSAWNDLETLLEEHPARIMLWEDEPTRETADRLKELGIESVVFNPCGNRPGSGDYLSVMKANVSALEAVLSSP